MGWQEVTDPGELAAAKAQTGINVSSAGTDGDPTKVSSSSDPVAAAIARGDSPGPRNISTPASQALMARVMAANPNYNAGTYPARQKAMISLGSGALGEQMKSLNTVMGHAGGLMDSMHALNNGEVGPVNAVQNGIAGMFGEPYGGAAGRLADVHTHLTGVAAEAARTFQGGAPPVQELHEWANNFSPNATPSAQTASFKALAGMLKSRMDAMQNQYNQTMTGSNTPVTQMLTPSARAMYQHILSTYPPDQANGQPSAPAGWAIRKVK